MIYLKKQGGSGQSEKVELYDDELYSVCYECGKEERITPQELAEIISECGSISGVSLKCRDCSKRHVHQMNTEGE